MIPAITEVNFPSYATLHQADVSLAEMGDRTITTQVRIDGDVVPDFSGWELRFRGERFILNTKEPQAAKDNSSRNSLVDLTFESWVIRELKRYFFFEAATVGAGTAIADKYKASVNLSIEDFVALFNQVLYYYFEGKVVMSLYMSGQGQYSTDRAQMDIDYTYLWDVLVKFYEVYDVRWLFDYDSQNDVYTIKVGYPSASIDDHVFQYGFSGGLLRFERQVQDVEIHNILLGRGGEKNIPYRYFKATDPQNPEWTADPDAIPELSNIYFDRLRDIVFRWYVRGWMQNPNHDTTWEDEGYVYPTYSDIPEEYAWAYQRGATDEKFNPVEFVKDDDSIAEYGERWGALDDNDDIYPTIQGVSRDPIGRIDEAVAISEIVTDDIEAMAREASVEISINEIRVALEADTNTQFSRLSEEFTVPAGSVGNISYVPFGTDTVNPGIVYFDTVNSTVVVVDANGTEHPVSGISPGTYRLKLDMVIGKDSPSRTATGTFGIQNIILTTSAMDADAWKPTFDIWVKNIWGTTKNQEETDIQYAERVWLPILGDRVGNEAKIVFSTGFMSISEDYEFTIVSYPVYDTSKTINGVPSEWRITLRKSDAEFDATGLYIPNATTGGQPVAGDKFFFTGIDMPFYYVQLAEEDLDTYKSSQLDTEASINPTWIINLDKVRCHSLLDGEYGQTLADRISAGAKVKITDPRFTPGKILTLYVQSVVYRWQEPTDDAPYIVPDIEVVLSDKVVAVEGTVQKIQNDVSYIKNQYARISDVEAVVRSVAEPIFLKKTGESDTSASPTQFASKVTSKGFRQGSIGGTGWGIYRDNTNVFRQQQALGTRAVGDSEEVEGDTVFETDRLIVRKEMQVNSLVINQISYVGGKEIISAAKIEVSKVIETDTSYICYFDQRRNSVANNFAVNDIAFGQVFNPDNTQLRYYKMVVTAVDIDSITLAKSGRDGSGAPEVGDIIVQYGNTTNANRQYVILRDVIGGGYERMLSGLNSVSATGNEYYFAGRQSTTGPRWFVGDSLGDYAEYVNGVLTIKANVIFKQGQVIPGLSDLDYLKEALPESNTIVSGGLILSSVIALRDAQDNVKSGINGDPSISNIAAWYGGPMADKDATPTPSSYATSLFRFDGSGYLAGGNIYWDANGYGGIPGITWSRVNNQDVVTIGANVRLASASGDTVTDMINAIRDLPNTYVDFVSAQTITGVKTFVNGIKIGSAVLTWVEGAPGQPGYVRISEAVVTSGDQIVGSGVPGGGGGGGGATNLYQLDDVSVSSRVSGDVLQYNGTNWVNVPATSLGGVTSVVGQTGAVTTTQIASALITAGYELTDTVYTLPVATLGARGGIKIGFTTSAANRNYAVQLSSEKAYVNVPWTDTVITDYWKTGDSRTANTVLAAPDGSNGAATFRALVAADIPTLAISKISGLQTALDGKVAKAGDTMTGDLIIEKAGGGNLILRGNEANKNGGTLYFYGRYYNGNPRNGAKISSVYPGSGGYDIQDLVISVSRNLTDATSTWEEALRIASTKAVSIASTLSVGSTITSAGLRRNSADANIGTSSSYWNYAYLNRVYLSGTTVYMFYDSTSQCVKIVGAGLLTEKDQIVGSGTPGGGGGGGASYLYELGDVLTDSGHSSVKQSDGSTNAAAGNIFAFNGSKWYALKLGSNLTLNTSGSQYQIDATNTTYAAGTGISISGSTVSLSSTYQTYATNGNTAYGWGNHANAGYAQASALSSYVLKAGDVMSGMLTIEDDTTPTGGIRGGNIILSRGSTSTANQSAGAITFYGRRLSGGWRNGARIAAEPSPGNTSYDREDLVFYRSNVTTEPANPAWEESMRISSQGQTTISGPYTYNLLINNTSSGATSAGIRFKTEGTIVGGIFVNSSNDLYFGAGSSSTGSKVLTASNYSDYALPLSAGSSYPLTGHLYITAGYGIQATGGIGLLVYHPSSGWSGITSTDWGVGSIDSPGVIRSNASNLTHYKANTAYTIWDASNSNLSTVDWAAKDLTAAGTGTFDNVVITNTSAAAHLTFSRANWNYVVFPSSGSVAFAVGSAASANVSTVINASGVRPGANATYDLGYADSSNASNNRLWAHVYAEAAEFVKTDTGPTVVFRGTSANKNGGTILFRSSGSNSNGVKIAAEGTTDAGAATTYSRQALCFYVSNVNSGSSPYTPVWKRAMRISYTGKVFFGDSANSYTTNVEVNGSITSTGDQVISSDAALKTNLRDLRYTTRDIAACRAVTFDWKDGHGHSAGSIAQDWKRLVPELVHGEEGGMTLAYGQLALINTVIEAREIEKLKKRIDDLEREIKRLRS